MHADIRLLREAVSAQGRSLAELTAQVARLTVRHDDQDAKHLEIEDKTVQELNALGARTDVMSTRLDEIFYALTKALAGPH